MNVDRFDCSDCSLTGVLVGAAAGAAESVPRVTSKLSGTVCRVERMAADMIVSPPLGTALFVNAHITCNKDTRILFKLN